MSVTIVVVDVGPYGLFIAPSSTLKFSFESFVYEMSGHMNRALIPPTVDDCSD